MFPKITITPNYFPAQWCDNINNWMLNNVEPHPEFGKRGVRRCTVRLLMRGMKPYDGVFRSMMDHVRANNSMLNVDIDFQIDGSIQQITYNPGDQVGWHNDLLDIQMALNSPQYKDLKTNRKLSMTVMLSDPTDYTGGKFVFDQRVVLPKVVEGKGTTAIFTSHTLHKVEEITSGVRNILFMFVTGPEWR